MSYSSDSEEFELCDVFEELSSSDYDIKNQDSDTEEFNVVEELFELY